MKKNKKRLVSVIRDCYIELRTPGVHCCLEFRVIEFVTIYMFCDLVYELREKKKNSIYCKNYRKIFFRLDYELFRH